MNKLLFPAYLLSLAFLLLSCNGEEDGPAETGTINPAELPELAYESGFSIGESESYMPGIIQNLEVLPNGHMVVLDRASTALHQFDEEGNWLQQIAGPGSGPGELMQHTRAGLTGDGIRTMATDGRVQLFTPDENGLLRFEQDLKVEFEDRSSTMTGRLGAGRNLMSQSEQIRITNQDNPDDIFPEYRSRQLFISDDDGVILKDSLLTAQSHNGLLVISENSAISLYSLPYRFTDILSIRHDGTFLYGNVETGQIKLFDQDGELLHELTVNIVERASDEEYIGYYLDAIPREHHDRALARIRELKPPFTHAFLDDDHRFWLRTDEGPDGTEYTVLDYDGAPLGRVHLPPDYSLSAVRNGMLYTRFVPDDDLHEVRVLSFSGH